MDLTTGCDACHHGIMRQLPIAKGCLIDESRRPLKDHHYRFLYECDACGHQEWVIDDSLVMIPSEVRNYEAEYRRILALSLYPECIQGLS